MTLQSFTKHYHCYWSCSSRPLPPELVKYAREDTHYLLYIYDRMRNELIRRGNKQNNFLHSVLDRSRDVSLKQYRKPLFSEGDYLRLYYKHKKTFNSQQVGQTEAGESLMLPW